MPARADLPHEAPVAMLRIMQSHHAPTSPCAVSKAAHLQHPPCTCVMRCGRCSQLARCNLLRNPHTCIMYAWLHSSLESSANTKAHHTLPGMSNRVVSTGLFVSRHMHEMPAGGGWMEAQRPHLGVAHGAPMQTTHRVTQHITISSMSVHSWCLYTATHRWMAGHIELHHALHTAHTGSLSTQRVAVVVAVLACLLLRHLPTAYTTRPSSAGRWRAACAYAARRPWRGHHQRCPPATQVARGAPLWDAVWHTPNEDNTRPHCDMTQHSMRRTPCSLTPRLAGQLPGMLSTGSATARIHSFTHRHWSRQHHCMMAKRQHQATTWPQQLATSHSPHNEFPVTCVAWLQPIHWACLQARTPNTRHTAHSAFNMGLFTWQQNHNSPAAIQLTVRQPWHACSCCSTATQLATTAEQGAPHGCCLPIPVLSPASPLATNLAIRAGHSDAHCTPRVQVHAQLLLSCAAPGSMAPATAACVSAAALLWHCCCWSVAVSCPAIGCDRQQGATGCQAREC